MTGGHIPMKCVVTVWWQFQNLHGQPVSLVFNAQEDHHRVRYSKHQICDQHQGISANV